ncbi:MAG: TIGR03086 family protein [Chloroflexi bacterium]|nr:TIGR03086 family protein [Chloroflexota bacterium]
MAAEAPAPADITPTAGIPSIDIPGRHALADDLEVRLLDPIRDTQRVLDDARAAIAALQPDDLARPTPCEAWDVRALVNHMIGVVSHFGNAFDGAPSPTASQMRGAPTDSEDLAGSDPASAYGRAVDRLMSGLTAPGALEKSVQMPFGALPAGQAAGIILADQLLHTWDLGKALGRPHAIDAGLAADVLQMMEGLLQPGFRGPGRPFGEIVECPADASIQDRLVAFAGRRP